MRTKSLASVTAMSCLGVLLAACGSSGVTVNSAPVTTTTTTSATTTTTTSEAPTTTSESPTTTSESPTTTSEAPTTTSAATPAPSLTSPDAIHKQAFLKIVKQRYPELTDAQALADGAYVCQQMSQDKGILNVISGLQAKHGKWTTEQAGFFLGLSVGALCSQYTSKIGS